jgi:uncharacterized DUF497 family protein
MSSNPSTEEKKKEEQRFILVGSLGGFSLWLIVIIAFGFVTITSCQRAHGEAK